MKKVTFLMMAIAIAFASCTKELTSDNMLSVSETNDATAASVLGADGKMSLSSTKSNYGALIDASTAADAFTFETGIASTLGLSCLRDMTPVPSVKKVKTLTSAYNILLNFTTTNAKPMKFRTDLTQYQSDLRSTIASLSAMPKMAIIENEESNKGYYSGSAPEYIAQLKAAISVMHSYNIPVTNGGITSTGLCYLTWQDYVNRGMTTEAADYKKRMKVAINSSTTKDRGAFIKVLIDSFAKMNLDYVNFHWRCSSAADIQGLGETIDYLKRATGKTVITTEIGQYDSDPATLTGTLDMCKSYNFPYIIWYDGEEDGRSYPLNYSSGILTATGVAYQGYCAAH